MMEQKELRRFVDEVADTNLAAHDATVNSMSDSLFLGITAENGASVRGQIMRWLFLLKPTPLGILRTHMIDIPAD